MAATAMMQSRVAAPLMSSPVSRGIATPSSFRPALRPAQVSTSSDTSLQIKALKIVSELKPAASFCNLDSLIDGSRVIDVTSFGAMLAFLLSRQLR